MKTEREKRHRGQGLAWAIVLGMGIALGAPSLRADDEVFRVGFSRGALGELKPHDATAALKGWAVGIAKSRGLEIAVEVQFFEESTEIPPVLKEGRLHAVALSAEEMLRNGLRPDRVLLQVRNGSWRTRYVVVVRRDGVVQRMQDLAHATVAVHRRAGSGLSERWFQHDLDHAAPGGAQVRWNPVSNGSKAVLRVFFRQDSACLIEAGALELACEMNPNLRTELRVLHESPEFVPQAFFYLPTFQGHLRRSVEEAIGVLHTTAAGRQVMQVFQGEKMEDLPLAKMEDTFRFLADALQDLDQKGAGR